MTSEDADYIFIDNGSTDPVENFLIRHLKPKRMNYIRNNRNIGLLKTYQQIYEACDTDILAITHNDVLIYEKDWDKRIVSYFEKMPNVGAAGFFAAQGCGPSGERIQDVPQPGMMSGWSNMLEAEVHGMRMNEPWHAAGIFDGLMMIFRMDMLRKAGGFDQRYKYHHIYDRDASLESLRHGYDNIVVNVPCHHLGGVTANRSDYQNWIKDRLTKDGVDLKSSTEGDIYHKKDESADMWTHNENSKTFAEKWKDVLPLYVENDFSFRTEQRGQWNFKGDKIRHL